MSKGNTEEINLDEINVENSYNNNTVYRIKMFDKFNLTKDEKKFIGFINACMEKDMDPGAAHIILSNFYLAKQLEESGTSYKSTSSRLFWITCVLIICALCQAAFVLLYFLKK